MYSFVKNHFSTTNIVVSRTSISLNLKHIVYAEDSSVWQVDKESKKNFVSPATEVHLINGEKISLDIAYNDFITKVGAEANLSPDIKPRTPLNLSLV